MSIQWASHAPSARVPRASFCRAAGLFALLTIGIAGPGCAHRGGAAPTPPLSAAAERYVGEADALAVPRFEEDFVQARLIYEALPVYTPARARLRSKLLVYLLGPLEGLDAKDLAARSGLVGDGAANQVVQSLRDAAALYAAEELWQAEGPAIAAEDGVRLAAGARLVRDLFAPRGAEVETATALAVLATLEPNKAEWPQQLEALLDWAEEGRQHAAGNGSMEGPPSSRQILETVSNVWPAPPVAERLARAFSERQDQMTRLLRRPMAGREGSEAGLVGEFLLQDSEGLPSTALGVAALYARCGQLGRAQAAAAALDGKPGDDPELRQLLEPFAAGGKPAPADFLALARRFLPKVPLLGGTSGDRLDGAAAMEILRLAVRHHPGHVETLILASRVARLVNAPLLSFRYLEEAEPLMAKAGADAEQQKALSKELFDLAFLLLRVHTDPENVQPLIEHADALRRRLDLARKKYGNDAAWLSDQALDLELAKSFVDAGLVDRARPIYDRAKSGGKVDVETTLQMANLLVKSGAASDAVNLLESALEQHQPEDPPNETVGYVQEHSKLARILGVAYESAGRAEDAERAYRIAVRGWERLFIDHVRRRNRDAAAEAAFEVGRLYYLLGRREEGITKFMEAINVSETRDQSYIDPLAFLVQRGEVDAALEVFRLAISRPSDTVSEYVKVYASLWVQDLTRRAGRAPEPSAVAYLEHIADRKLQLRPLRATAWYVPLARFAIGRISYAELSTLANTSGRKAELYFYEAMRKLAEGHADDAHALWTQVLDTKMVSFFEFEMAARYLRHGAPSAPNGSGSDTAETI